jgi:Na+/proline symporter
LASNTKKSEEKVTTSLRLFFNLFIIVVFIIAFCVAVLGPWIFHSGRRKRRVDDGLGALKTHRSVHLSLTLL